MQIQLLPHRKYAISAIEIRLLRLSVLESIKQSLFSLRTIRVKQKHSVGRIKFHNIVEGSIYRATSLKGFNIHEKSETLMAAIKKSNIIWCVRSCSLVDFPRNVLPSFS
jgi:hypothetical protein